MEVEGLGLEFGLCCFGGVCEGGEEEEEGR